MRLSVPIVRGPLRGHRWLPASGGKLLRILAGTYEHKQTQWFERLLSPGDRVLDIGAHVGYYTLLSAALVGPRGRVYAFEPSPVNVEFLRWHVEINRPGNVQVIEAAVSDMEGNLRFAPGTGTGTGHLADAGPLEVRAIRIDDFVAERNERPAAMKIDVEGAELAVLEGARNTLERHRPVILLSTHGRDRHQACLAALRGLGYRLAPILGDDVESTSEIVCAHPDRESALPMHLSAEFRS